MTLVASKYQLVIESGNLSGTTGHHTIQCHILETRPDGAPVRGVPETFGIEAVALQRKFGGDAGKWRDWVAGVMLERHKQRVAVDAEVMKWSGKAFEIPDK
ncbi:MAG TPA: hypothetical protein VJX30_01545 [Terriglobales bacterium]|jgi:hypothetical protein|nr:hypothetical protein [Terriglobales bacterium]